MMEEGHGLQALLTVSSQAKKKKKKRQMGSEELSPLIALTNRVHSVHLTDEARIFSFVHHHFVHLS